MWTHVLVTFDLKNAVSDDYTDAYEALRAVGFRTEVHASTGKDYILPNTTCTGLFQGNDIEELRNRLADEVKSRFQKLGLSAYFFILVSPEPTTWGLRVTGTAELKEI